MAVRCIPENKILKCNTSNTINNTQNESEDKKNIQLDKIQGNLIKFTTFDAKEVIIEKNDLKCLDGQNYLNDIVIHFYLEYIRSRKLIKEKAKKCYIFSTYFFASMLNKKRSQKTDNHYLEASYDFVKKWTKNLDIFNYEYLIVPIFNANHWNLAIICNAGKLISNVADTESKKRTCLLFMDSIGTIEDLPEYSRLLRFFIQKEMENKKMIIKLITSKMMPSINLTTPHQKNNHDCGLFLLHYVELFLNNPNIIFSKSRLTKIDLRNWFDQSVLVSKRMEIFNAIIEIHKENLKDSKNFIEETTIHDDGASEIEVEENEYTRQLECKKQKRKEHEIESPRKMNRKSNEDIEITNVLLTSSPEKMVYSPIKIHSAPNQTQNERVPINVTKVSMPKNTSHTMTSPKTDFNKTPYNVMVNEINDDEIIFVSNQTKEIKD